MARAAADLVLLDDNFGSIVAAIREGRKILFDIQRAFLYLLAFHVPIVGLALLAPLLGAPLLLLPIHLVWLELVVHPVSALLFQGDPAPADLMRRPPRDPAAPLLPRRGSARSLASGALLTAAVFAIYLVELGRGETWARGLALATLLAGTQLLVIAERAGPDRDAGPLLPRSRQFWLVWAASGVSLPILMYCPRRPRSCASPRSQPGHGWSRAWWRRAPSAGGCCRRAAERAPADPRQCCAGRARPRKFRAPRKRRNGPRPLARARRPPGTGLQELRACGPVPVPNPPGRARRRFHRPRHRLLRVGAPLVPQLGRQPELSRAELPGDHLLWQGAPRETRAIVIGAPAAEVWPWVAQIGQDRGGFYSYELLENLAGCELTNLDQLLPARQHWTAGDKLWMYPPEKMTASDARPSRSTSPGTRWCSTRAGRARVPGSAGRNLGVRRRADRPRQLALRHARPRAAEP